MSTSQQPPVLPPRFRRNVVSVYLAIVLSAVIVLVMTPVLIGGLGKNGYGLWVLLTSLAPYATLLDLGLGAATVKYVAEHYRRDADATSRTISTSLAALSLLGLLVLAAGIPFSFFFPRFFDVAAGQHTTAVVSMLLLSFSAALSLPGSTFESVLMGIQRYDVTNFTVLAVVTAQAVAWTVILATGGGIVELTVATVAFEAAGHATRFVAARRALHGVSLSFAGFDRLLARRLVQLSGWIALGNVSSFVVRQIDPVVVGAIVSVPAAGVYAVGQRLSVGVDLLIRPMMTGFLPHASDLSARDERELLRTTMLAGTRLTLAFAGPICLVVVVLAGPAIQLWVGNGFAPARNVAIFLSAAITVTAVTRPAVLMSQGSGRARAVARLVAVEAALNLALSIWLGKTIGLQGVALATLIASAVVRLALMIPYVCRSIGISVVDWIGSLARAHLPPIAATLAVGWLVTRADLLNVAAFLGAGVAVTATYVAAFAATGLRADERRRIVATARRLGKRSLVRMR